MKQLILYIIFLMSMVFSGYGEVSAASVSLSHQDSLTVEATDAAHKKDGSYAAEASHSKDRLAKVTPTSRSRMPSWKMHPMPPIGYAAVVHSVCCQVATYMATHLQAVDC